MNIVDRELDMSKLIEGANLIVRNSFGRSGKYHKYLQDYAETYVFLQLFTDYEIQSNNDDPQQLEVDLINEVLAVFYSDEWQNDILPNLSYQADVIRKYVASEIDMKTRPLANFDNVLVSLNEVLVKLSEMVSDIDPEKLGVGLAQLANIANSMTEQREIEEVQE